MHSIIPISLAQLKTGNNSEKRKNEIMQVLYSLYRSKSNANKRTMQTKKQGISIKVWLTLFKNGWTLKIEFMNTEKI